MKVSSPVHLLLTQPLPQAIEQRLQADYQLHRLWQAADAGALLNAVGPLIQGVVTGGAKGLDNATMDRLPALKIIAISGIGTDAVDLAHAARRNIAVTTTPGVLTDDVADMAFGLLIATLRRMSEAESVVRSGSWPQAQLPLARKVTGIRLGIIGMGQVGAAIARRAGAFQMEVLYHSRSPRPALPWRYIDDLHTLAREADVLVLAASADGGETIVTASVLEALGAEGFFINVARGKLVDEEALLAALTHKRIAGAGLDVFANEPHVPAAFFALPQVTLQPHRASATQQTRLEMGEIVLRNLAACFNGETPPNKV